MELPHMPSDSIGVLSAGRGVVSPPAEKIAGRAGVKTSNVCYLHGCPVCQGTATRHYCRVPSLFTDGEFIAYERCGTCDVVFRNPRLPDRERVAKYEEKPVLPEQTHIDPLSQAHCHHLAQRLRQRLPSSTRGRLLDFGCGAGGFLLEARKAGFDVAGLEVGRALARFVTSTYGIPVFCGEVNDPAFAGERFDVIVSRQVFEHLVDPRGTLEALIPHLARPGLLLIEVPNLRHVRERLRRGATMDDSHLFYFSRNSLSRMLEACGFRVLHVSEGLRPFRFAGQDASRIPPAVVSACEHFFSLCQIKTGLSILAELPA
jgi:SAM-dependent methyltransferase